MKNQPYFRNGER